MYRPMVHVAAVLAALLLVSCSRAKREDPTSVSYANDVARIQEVKKHNPKSKIIAFYFPMDVNAESVEVFLNGVRIRTTYAGQRRKAFRGEQWTCQVLVDSDIESGKVVIGDTPLTFSLKRSTIENVYFVELFKDAAKGGFDLYQGTQPRGGGYI